MSNYHLTWSKNRKTGPIPVSTSPRETCPTSCPFYGAGCYALNRPLSIHWRKLSSGERGASWDVFLQRVSEIPQGALWRHNQAGDLPSKDGRIDMEMLRQLLDANRGKRGWTYTHWDVLGDGDAQNRDAIRAANAGGFTVNLSADNLAEADQMSELKIAPVVTVLNSEYGRRKKETVVEWRERVKALGLRTPAGRPVQVCSAATGNMTCAQCGICARTERRETIIGFPAHGNGRKKVDEIYEKSNL